jgi:hypothetical protein
MNKPIAWYPVTIFASLLLVFSVGAKAQPGATPQKSDPLFQTIVAQDKALFDAYNTCDLKTLGSMVTDDLEFYHDKTGLATGKQSFLDSIKDNICGKVTRELVPGTLEVYPLAGYGAVEIGTHRFQHPWVQDHGVVGEAKFVMVWQNKAGVWKIARVISYDHAALP